MNLRGNSSYTTYDTYTTTKVEKDGKSSIETLAATTRTNEGPRSYEMFTFWVIAVPLTLGTMVIPVTLGPLLRASFRSVQSPSIKGRAHGAFILFM